MAPIQSEASEENNCDDTPETEEDADGWTELMDGLIRKRTVQKGEGEVPEMNADVVCSVEIRAAPGDAPNALQHYRDARFRIGEGDAVPALELCLRHMLPGEVAELSCVSRMAWGPEGLPAVSDDEVAVPPDSDLVLKVTLHKILPDVASLSGKEAWDSKVAEISWRKARGTDHFKRKQFKKAARSYEKGLEIFPETPILAPRELGRSADHASEHATGIVADLGSNLAAVRLELGETVGAKEAAENALEVRPEHHKALYRLAKALLLISDHEKCEATLEKLQKLQPEDTGVKKLAADLRNAKRKYATKSKAMGAKLLEANRRPETDKEEQEEEEDEPWWREITGPINWRLVGLAAMIFAVVLVVVVLAPSQYKTYIIIGSLLATPFLLAWYSITHEKVDESKGLDLSKFDRLKGIKKKRA